MLIKGCGYALTIEISIILLLGIDIFCLWLAIFEIDLAEPNNLQN